MPNRTILEREFEELFKANYSRLFYCALDWVENAETAKDLVSELFSDVWKDYERLRNEQVEAYLFRSIRNRSLNNLRHKQVEMRYQQLAIEMRESVIDNDIDTHEANLQLIDNVIDNLSPQTRFIFEQCHFEGRKYKEIADLMNISVSAVHKHMNKAFTAFREAFKKNQNKGNQLIP